MKKVLLTLSTVVLALSVFAQGTVQYYNNGSGLKAPIYGPETPDNTVSKFGNTTAGIPAGTQVYTGAPLAGAAYRAQFYGGNGTGLAPQALGPATTVNTFRTGSAAGYLGITTATINAITPDAPLNATLQLRAWNNSSGLYPDWDSVRSDWSSGAVAAGVSTPFDAINLPGAPTIGGGNLTAGLPTGLRSFNIYFVVPEPSTFALAGLGAAAMLIFRRRK